MSSHTSSVSISKIPIIVVLSILVILNLFGIYLLTKQNIADINQDGINDYQSKMYENALDLFNEAIEIVEKLNDDSLSGVFHCFTGDVGDAKRITDLGNFYLGIGGVLTFKNSGLDNTIKEIDIAHLILETDSPYLTPTPFRGKRNESKYIRNIAEKLAEVKGISLDEISEVTNRNASNLFKIF